MDMERLNTLDNTGQWNWLREVAADIYTGYWLGDPEDVYPDLARDLVDLWREQNNQGSYDLPIWWDDGWEKRLVEEVQHYVDDDMTTT